MNTFDERKHNSEKNTSIVIDAKKLEEHEMSEVLDILVEAFQSDPFVKKQYHKYKDFRLLMELETMYVNDLGTFLIALDGVRIIGMLSILPPDAKTLSVKSVLNRRYFKQVVRIMKKTSFKTLINMIKVSFAFSENKIEKCHYLLLVAVSDDYRGMGIGKRLIEHAIDRFDDGFPIYLENSNPKNTSLYISLGFEVLKETENGVCNMVRRNS